MKRYLWGAAVLATVGAASYALGTVAGDWYITRASAARTDPAPVERSSPPSGGHVAAPTASSASDSPSPRALPSGAPVPSLERPGTVLDRPVFEEWEAFVRASPASAATLRNAVVDVMIARQTQAELESCFSSDDVSGTSTLRLAVDVRAAGRELIVGDATFVGVLDGDQVESAVGECVRGRLTGSTRVAATSELSTYRGRVEYTVAIGRRTSTR